MATTTRVKQWGFSDDNIYTLADDAAIVLGALSMTAPRETLTFGENDWDVVPDGAHYDGNGDLVVQKDVLYTAQPGGDALSMADGAFVFWTKRTSVLTSNSLDIYLRYDTDKVRIATPTDQGAWIYNGAGAEVLSELSFGDSLLNDGTWREVMARFVGDDVRLEAVGYRDVQVKDIDRTAAGAVALTQANDASGGFVVGNGGAQAVSYIAHRRTGSCELKAANAWTIPYGTTALGYMSVVADRSGGGTVLLALNLQYKVTGGTGDSDTWTDLPADGDLSGESFTAGTSTVLWRLNDGSALGMDNALDPRYVPSVYAVTLTYSQTTPDWNSEGHLKDAAINIKAALNADDTLMAYEGWSGASVGWPEVGDPKIYHRCGCLLVWEGTPEQHRGKSKEAGELVEAFDQTHTIKVLACMKPDRDLEDMLIGDSQLYDFAEDVKAVLRLETLGGTVHSVGVKNAEPLTIFVEAAEGEDEPGDLLLAIEVEVEVHGKLSTATRS